MTKYAEMVQAALESQSGKWMSRASIKSFLAKNHGYVDTPMNKSFLKKALAKFEKKGDSFRMGKNTKDAAKSKAKAAIKKEKLAAKKAAAKAKMAAKKAALAAKKQAAKDKIAAKKAKIAAKNLKAVLSQVKHSCMTRQKRKTSAILAPFIVSKGGSHPALLRIVPPL